MSSDVTLTETIIKPGSGMSKTRMWILIAVCVGIAILALFLLVCFCCAIKTRDKGDNTSSSISSASDKDNYILENKFVKRVQIVFLERNSLKLVAFPSVLTI